MFSHGYKHSKTPTLWSFYKNFTKDREAKTIKKAMAFKFISKLPPFASHRFGLYKLYKNILLNG